MWVMDVLFPLVQTHSKWSNYSIIPLVSFIVRSQFPKEIHAVCLTLQRDWHSVFCHQPLFVPFKKLSFLVHWFWRWWYRQSVERVCSIQMFHPPPITGVLWTIKLQCDVGSHGMCTCHMDGPDCTALRSYFPVGNNRLRMDSHHTLALREICLGRISEKSSGCWKAWCKEEGFVMFCVSWTTRIIHCPQCCLS